VDEAWLNWTATLPRRRPEIKAGSS
jgi:hypothetical protein